VIRSESGRACGERLRHAARLANVVAGCALGLVALSGGATSAWASEGTSVNAHLRMTYMGSSRDLDRDRDAVSATAHLKVRHELSERDRLELEGRTTLTKIESDTEESLRLISAFASIRRGDLDFRIGQQRVRWGKADVVNPTDYFTPTDFRAPLPLEEDRYLSIAALRADWRVDDERTVSLVIQPGFVRSELPRTPPVAGVRVVEDRPRGEENPQVGVRFLHTGASVDWSVSAFSGYSNLPAASATLDASTGGLHWLQHHPRVLGVGADVAAALGPWNLRAEASRVSHESIDGRLTPSNQYFAVVGADRTIDDVNLNVQVLHRLTTDRVLAAQLPLPQQLAAEQNAVIFNQFERRTWGLSARLAVQWLNQTLQTELLYIAYFEPTSGLVRPLLTYSLSDESKVILGGEHYFGSRRSFFGPFKANRTWFAEYQHHL
jgi:hypothetical protein